MCHGTHMRERTCGHELSHQDVTDKTVKDGSGCKTQRSELKDGKQICCKMQRSMELKQNSLGEVHTTAHTHVCGHELSREDKATNDV
jgi:hypothetical protein